MFRQICGSYVSFWFVCRSLAIGIGIQNFPEGLAVSLPLRAAGVSLWKSFWLVCVCLCVLYFLSNFVCYRWGQLSGMVEPAAGLFGAIAIVVRLE